MDYEVLLLHAKRAIQAYLIELKNDNWDYSNNNFSIVKAHEFTYLNFSEIEQKAKEDLHIYLADDGTYKGILNTFRGTFQIEDGDYLMEIKTNRIEFIPCRHSDNKMLVSKPREITYV